jgi:hypothetical protein
MPSSAIGRKIAKTIAYLPARTELMKRTMRMIITHNRIGA